MKRIAKTPLVIALPMVLSLSQQNSMTTRFTPRKAFVSALFAHSSADYTSGLRVAVAALKVLWQVTVGNLPVESSIEALLLGVQGTGASLLL